jgi:hypothetical protein
MGDRPGLTVDEPVLGQQRHGAGLRLLDGLAGELVVVALRRRGVGRLPPSLAPGDGAQAAVALDDGAQAQPELPPPRDVGGVAERADHGEAGALRGIGQVVCDDRHLGVEQRRGSPGPEQRLVAVVVGVRNQGDAGRQQLGTRGVDPQRPPVGALEADLVVGAGDLTILHLGLRDGGLEVDVPQRG